MNVFAEPPPGTETVVAQRTRGSIRGAADHSRAAVVQDLDMAAYPYAWLGPGHVCISIRMVRSWACLHIHTHG